MQYAIDASPIRRHVLREAYEWFRDWGELPDDEDHVAYEVVQQALRGGEEAPPMEAAALTNRVRKAALAYQDRTRPSEDWPPTVRKLLFDEALFEPPALRRVARAAIACEVAFGGDVENVAFCARHGMPEYGAVAMHVLGWRRTLVRPPYEHQAERLFVRLDNLRGRIDHDDPRWFEKQDDATVAFWQTGELPEDDLLRDAALVGAEEQCLLRHKKGKDVSELMAALDAAARATGEHRDEAIATVQGLVRARTRRGG